MRSPFIVTPSNLIHAPVQSPLFPRLPSNGSTLKFVALRSWAPTHEAVKQLQEIAIKNINILDINIVFEEPTRTMIKSFHYAIIVEPLA